METTAQPIQTKKKKTSIWKIILGILFFPIALTIIIAKKKKMKPIMKIVLIVILWVFVLVVGVSNSEETPPAGSEDNIPGNVIETPVGTDDISEEDETSEFPSDQTEENNENAER